MNTILSWNVRGILIGGLFLSAEICHASTINAPKISPKALKILPQFRFLKKETIVNIPIRVNIVHSPVLDFAPWLELHHVVFVGEPGAKKVYAVDYSPINQSENIMKLLFGIDVPAEIRVRLLKADDINDVEDVKRKWSCLNMMTCSTNSPSLEDVLRTDEELLHAQKFIKRIVKKWDTSMNLYTHNCQHFSGFVQELLKNEEICPI